MRDDSPATSSGDTIDVDFDALRALAGQLRDLVQQLSLHGAIVQPELDRDLFGKLAAVDRGWSLHRRQLQSFLSDTATTVDRIVAEYEKTDDLIASAANSR